MFKKLQLCAQIVGFATLILLSAVGALALTGNGFPAWAQTRSLTTLSGVPNVISYQGMLRSTDGTPVDGPHNITLRLYTTPSGGEAIHKETLANEMVRAGLFTVLLGDQSGNPIPASAFRKPLYVSVQVGKGQEMAPRQRIAPVPYAVQLTDGIYVDRAGNTVNVIVGDGASRAHMVIPQGGLCVAAKGGCLPQTGMVTADRVDTETLMATHADAGDLKANRVDTIELEAQALSAEHIRLLGSPEEVEELRPGDGYWGSWGAWATCPAGSYVCAAQVRIEGKQGGGDDTAMNGIRLKCCSLGSAPSPSAGLVGQ
jgi:hypothetical protein